ncbi:MAG: ferritin-like domain-containing protein [Nocardioidaceae bacterium]|nr:ferritin-like domain-containing protein [Nocardioidaceae bacterium]
MSAGTADEGLVEAWQQALAAEHASVYGYGVLAGRLDRDSPAQVRATGAYRVHLARRDTLAARVADAGATPVQPAPAYDLGGPVTDAGSARLVAQRIEDRCTVVHAVVVSAADGDRRTEALGWLTDCATRLVGWGGSATALPGFERP